MNTTILSPVSFVKAISGMGEAVARLFLESIGDVVLVSRGD